VRGDREWAQNKTLRVAARDSILQYRGFPIRNRSALATRRDLSALCRMQFGDTAQRGQAATNVGQASLPAGWGSILLPESRGKDAP